MFFFSIAIVVSIVSFSLGLFMALRPSATIEFQRRFYEKINWRIGAKFEYDFLWRVRQKSHYSDLDPGYNDFTNKQDEG